MAWNRSVLTGVLALLPAILGSGCDSANRSPDAAGPPAAQAAPATAPAGSGAAEATAGQADGADRRGRGGATLEARRPAAATAWVIFGADTVTAEVAQTDEERGRGLMHRETLGPDAGMLFIFPEQSVRSFWMQDTYIPLDIAFMDREFLIVDIQQMDPMTTTSHVSRAPATYALEVNQGWFEAHGVRVGDRPEVVFGR